MIRHVEKLNFTIIAKPEDYKVNYTIYDNEGIDLNGNVLFHRKNASCHPDIVENIEDAEIFIHGEVKWDGCSNWHFDEQDRVMIHGCCKEDVERLGLILGICWDMTKDLCPHWSY